MIYSIVILLGILVMSVLLIVFVIPKSTWDMFNDNPSNGASHSTDGRSVAADANTNNSTASTCQSLSILRTSPPPEAIPDPYVNPVQADGCTFDNIDGQAGWKGNHYDGISYRLPLVSKVGNAYTRDCKEFIIPGSITSPAGCVRGYDHSGSIVWYDGLGAYLGSDNLACRSCEKNFSDIEKNL